VALVVGFDRHPASRAAVQFAGALAGALTVALHVVHVADDSDSTIGAGPTAADDERRTDERQVRAMLESTGVQWSFHLTNGDPVAALIEAAAEHAASMIVVGLVPGWLLSVWGSGLGLV
jgi:nucleotide-binding universal stress UspA family protein